MKCFLILFLLQTVAFAPLAQSTQEEISRRIVHIGTDAGYEPFTFLDENSNLVGFEVDLIKEICLVLDFDCRFQHEGLQFNDLLPILSDARVDVVHGVMGITNDRLRNFDFLLYYKATKYFFGKKGIEVKRIPDDLSGLRIGVEADTKFVNYVQALSSELERVGLSPIKVIELKDTAAVREAHLNGEIDLHPAGQGLIEAWKIDEQFQNFEAVGPELISGFKGEIFGIGDGFAFRKGARLQYKFGKAMQILLDNCRYAEIEKKYLRFSNAYTPLHCR